MNLTRGHVNALRHQQVSGRKRDGVTVVHQVLRVLSAGAAKEGDRCAGLRERVHGRKGLAGSVDRRADADRVRAANRRSVSGRNELLERASRFTGLRVD